MNRDIPQESLKATVVSLFPLEINETKPGLYPGYFVIPAAPLGDFSFLIVGDGIYYQETKNDVKTQVRTPYYTLAESICQDFQTSHIGRVPEIAEPGLFWVAGQWRKQEIRDNFADELDKWEKRQLAWFTNLVEIADDTYARTQRHTSVSALQRLAAKRLSIQRPWIIRTGESANSCRFCKAEVPYGAVKCPTCREILDMVAYRELQGEISGVAEPLGKE
jgi:hypothetical protein